MKGYTVFEVMWLIVVLATLGLIGTAIYVAHHFIAMYW